MASLSAMPQSFLFSGPRRLGKFSVAREFAQILTNTPVDGMTVDGGDIITIGRWTQPSRGESEISPALSVEDIRKADEFLSRFPTTGKYRVAIIDAAERLTLSAENALLKMLEEPNSTSVIILITHLPGKLLPTVRSRLFNITFPLLPPDEVRTFFSNSKIPDFFFSLGLPGLIAAAGETPEVFEKQKNLLRGLFQLSRLTWKERLSLAERMAEDPDGISALLEVWLVGLRRQQNEETWRSLAFAKFLEALLETLDRISLREGNPRLLLEKLFTKI